MNAKVKGLGLFSKLSRKSISDLSEWNKNDEKLMQCVEQSNLKDIVSLLKKKKVCPTKLDPQGHSALHVAAMRNKYDVVQLLIAYNATVTAVDFQGRTALHCAARHGASEVLEVLSHSKDDDWPKDESKLTALHHACIGGNLDCVINLIIKYPKDAESGDEDGRTPLFYAAQIGHQLVCKELLDRGAKVNAQDRFGRTALMCAAENGNRLICELFVKKGANIELCDGLGRTASWHAMDAGHTTVRQAIDPASQPLAAQQSDDTKEMEYPSRQRVHSPILEETDSVLGDDDTLPLRFRSCDISSELKISEEEADDVEIDLGLSGADSDDDEFKSDSEDDGSISPRLSELSYTMSHVKEESSIAHDTDTVRVASNLGTQLFSGSDRTLTSAINTDGQEHDDFLSDGFDSESDTSVDRSKHVMVTDLDADDDVAQKQTISIDVKDMNASLMTPSEHVMTSSKLVMTSSAPSSKAMTSQNEGKYDDVSSVTSQRSKSDILMMSDGISLSTDSCLSSDDDTEVPSVSRPTQSQSSEPYAASNTDLKQAYDALMTKYNNLKSDYDDVVKQLYELQKDQRRQSQEELEITEHMDMVLQLSELSSRLDDEQAKNRQLQAQITTLENLAVDVGARAQEPSVKSKVENEPENCFSYDGEYEDSDDDFGFPGLCLLNNTSGKSGKEEVKPIAKVSGRPRQISLSEENKEIAKLKTEIESLERQKHSLTEVLTQLQSKFEESEHNRKKLLSDLDVSKTTLDVKSHENFSLMTENTELKQNVRKYRDRCVTAVDHTKTYKKEIEKLSRKLELYDREYRKVKERIKRKDANEKRMLKDRQTMMKKLDESVRRTKEGEKALEAVSHSSHAEADSLLVKCEELESELAILKDFNEDQHLEVERLTDVAECNEEMLDLKQLEVQSLEKQITLLRDISTTPQRRESFRETQSTIKSLQDQVIKLQSQLAETAENYQDTIDIYRNNLIMASKNLLDPDVKEALLYVVELRKTP